LLWWPSHEAALQQLSSLVSNLLSQLDTLQPGECIISFSVSNTPSAFDVTHPLTHPPTHPPHSPTHTTCHVPAHAPTQPLLVRHTLNSCTSAGHIYGM
jgi:hypothetical protein